MADDNDYSNVTAIGPGEIDEEFETSDYSVTLCRDENGFMETYRFYDLDSGTAYMLLDVFREHPATLSVVARCPEGAIVDEWHLADRHDEEAVAPSTGAPEAQLSLDLPEPLATPPDSIEVDRAFLNHMIALFPELGPTVH